MYDYDRLAFYISSLSSDNSPLCERIGEEARKRGVPVIRRESEGFFKTILALKKPENILEIGTAVGYSTLIMAENTSDKCRITTIEIGEDDYKRAVCNFKAANFSDRIKALKGDAAKIILQLADSYDFVFLDAAKGQYLKIFNSLKKLLKPGAVVLSDNVLQGGDVLKSRFIIEQRDRTVHKRMREFLYEITHDKDFVTSIVPTGDGMAVSVFK